MQRRILGQTRSGTILDRSVNFFHRNRRLVKNEINAANCLEISIHKLGHAARPPSRYPIILRRGSILVDRVSRFFIKGEPSNLPLCTDPPLRDPHPPTQNEAIQYCTSISMGLCLLRRPLRAAVVLRERGCGGKLWNRHRNRSWNNLQLRRHLQRRTRRGILI
jgi:hypothetical protein